MHDKHWPASSWPQLAQPALAGARRPAPMRPTSARHVARPQCNCPAHEWPTDGAEARRKRAQRRRQSRAPLKIDKLAAEVARRATRSAPASQRSPARRCDAGRRALCDSARAQLALARQMGPSRSASRSPNREITINWWRGWRRQLTVSVARRTIGARRLIDAARRGAIDTISPKCARPPRPTMPP